MPRRRQRTAPRLFEDSDPAGDHPDAFRLCNNTICSEVRIPVLVSTLSSRSGSSISVTRSSRKHLSDLLSLVHLYIRFCIDLQSTICSVDIRFFVFWFISGTRSSSCPAARFSPPSFTRSDQAAVLYLKPIASLQHITLDLQDNSLGAAFERPTVHSSACLNLLESRTCRNLHRSSKTWFGDQSDHISNPVEHYALTNSIPPIVSLCQ
jgi:hypothetical protein